MTAGVSTVRGADGTRGLELATVGLLAATLGWGGAFIAGKLVAHEVSPLSASAWRFGGAALLLLPFGLRHLRTVALRPVAVPLALMVVCGGIVYPWLFMASLARTSATNTSLIIAIMPVLTCLLCPLVGESISARRWSAVGIALLGAVIVISRGDPRRLMGLGTLNAGDLLALAAAGVWSVFNLASRRVVATLPSTLVNSLVFGGGGLALFALATPEQPIEQLRVASPVALAGLAYLAVVPSVLSGLAYLRAVRVLGLSRTVVFIYCVPFVTATLAALVLGENLNGYQGVGGALIFAGLLLALERSGSAQS
jgi:drug/metabolite transporter (DMT)-like permease